MKNVKKHLGFDDTWLMVIGIPMSAIIIMLMVFGMNVLMDHSKYCFVIAFAFTIVYWFAFRLVIIKYHQKYPGYEFNSSRLGYIFIRLLIVYLLVKYGLGYLLNLIVPDHVAFYNANKISPFVAEISEILMISLFFFVYEGIYYLNKSRLMQVEKNELQKITAEQKLNTLKNQVNPHFLFNSLNTVVTMIPDEPKLAIEFVQNLSKTYRNILEVRDEKLIPIKQELIALDSYIYLLKTRFQGKIQIYNHLDRHLLDKFILPLSLQILLENAVKHNITSKSKPLRIGISEEAGYIVVQNNLQKKEQQYNSTKMGLANIRSRYKLLVGEEILVEETEDAFTVKLPIIENSAAWEYSL